MKLEETKDKYKRLLINRLAKALAPAYAKGHIVAALEAKMVDEDARVIKPDRMMFLDKLKAHLEPILAYYDAFADSLVTRIEEELEAGKDPVAIASDLRADIDWLMNEEYVAW